MKKQSQSIEVQYLYMIRYSYVYFLTNKYNTVIYVGVTSNIIKRIYEHKNKLADGFSSKYNLNKLVYYETFEDITEAIKREKQIKGGSRLDKIKLIKSFNPEFNDLYDQIV